ncbi:ATP-binding protein [Verminephrobacter aporrectodeae subsp. tuberculatae]|uniref:TrlF family AAA-like ATPase n=1 Tax=Verminephrobacter aporrectodeae TaxID=1110389 RepID=UPI0002375450|nr:AAA family ATPase [Verminephrobacter aporrectodeae]MCW8166260.1 ATP-binding protein [Verminephrobacter aporrectodeae subsp. tuberculatae]MCW8170298.1 ATP-binding protein [Verminephrobacter aporrectodeae subsp. tuberculatae]
MDQGITTVNPRGSTWQRWDPHIHAPGTALNDGYAGADPWAVFLEKIEKSDPPIRVLGITDYCGIDCYVKTVERQKGGHLQGVGLIFPNIEFRLSIETAKGPGINLHLLFSPEAPDHADRIRAFLSGLTFSHQQEKFRCIRPDLIRLGRTFDAALTNEDSAYREGVNQFKVRLDALQDAFNDSAWLRANCLVAVSGGGTDGTSGLQGDGGQWAATRKNIERFAHIIFSANPKQVAFYLGRGAATLEDMEKKWGGRKPCLHGSDAHSADRVGLPDQMRRCWLHGDLTFETLRQAVIEPEGRVHIGEAPPQGALPGNAIRSVHVSDAPWMSPALVPINAGMVAIIGARGSGKTALADFIATGAYGVSDRLNANSFLHRAKKFLRTTRAELLWENDERTANEVTSNEHENLWDAAHVQYLSQQFVEQLCSSEGLEDSLVDEIQRVIFDAHPEEDRLDVADFTALLTLRMQAARDARDRHRHTLGRATDSINTEYVRKDGLPQLEKDRDETIRTLTTDQANRSQLLPKGQDQRAKQLEDFSTAVEAKRRTLAGVQARVQALASLQTDVSTFRTQTGSEWLVDAQERRADAGLSKDDWKQFEVDFTGDVDSLLRQRLERARAEALRIQGMAPKPPANGAPAVPDPNVPLIANGTDLSTQPLNLLTQERARLQKLAGIDEQNARRYRLLTEKITHANSILPKLNTEIERAKKADEMLRQLRGERTEAYRGIFTAIIEEERELSQLYAPLQERIAAGSRAVKKLSFSVRREVNTNAWAEHGEQLLDLRKGSFRRGELLNAAEDLLGNAWRRGSADDAAVAMKAFMDRHAGSLPQQRPENMPRLEWSRSVSEWLYNTDHIQVGYGLRYEDVDIERLSPGTRGIVLLLLYLAIDAHDDRPLIIDQPEENLDPQSVFEELVPVFCEAKKRRQIIIVTHNANLVVNTDVDQVIVARCGAHQPDELPKITYESGGLENPKIREAVCSILEGGERAFQERARRLRVNLTAPAPTVRRPT